MVTVSGRIIGVTAMMMFGILSRRYHHRITLILGAMPHRDGGHPAQRKGNKRDQQDQRLQSSNHGSMLTRAKKDFVVCAG